MVLQSLQADTEYRITVVKSSTSLEYGGCIGGASEKGGWGGLGASEKAGL